MGLQPFLVSKIAHELSAAVNASIDYDQQVDRHYPYILKNCKLTTKST